MTNQPTAPSAASASTPIGDDVVVVGSRPKSQVPIGLWILAVGALVPIGLWGMSRFSSFIAPTFLALTLVLTVRPIHRWMIRHGIPPWLSAFWTTLVLIAVLGSIIGLTIVSLLPLPQVIAEYQASYQTLINDISRFFQDSQFINQAGISTDNVQETLARLDFNALMGWAVAAINQVSNIATMFAIVVMAIFFIVVDTLVLTERSKIVEKARPDFFKALSGFEGRVRQYWLVASIFGAIVAVFDWVVLEAMGIPLAMTWALLSFVTNYIPNIGFVLGLAPPALFGLLEGGWQLMVWVIVAYSLINFIIQSLLQPKFTADVVGLSATVTFLSLLLWAVVLGPLGALLAVPLTLFFKAILVDSSPETRWMDAFLTSEADVRKKNASGNYETLEPVPEVWTGIQSAVAQATRQVRKPVWKRTAMKKPSKPRHLLRKKGKREE